MARTKVVLVGSGQRAPVALDAEQVRLEYARKLIALLGAEGADRDDLMARIERVLGHRDPHPGTTGQDGMHPGEGA